MQMLKYPHTDGNTDAHTDYGCITLLLPGDEGLQVRTNCHCQITVAHHLTVVKCQLPAPLRPNLVTARTARRVQSDLQ